MDIYSVANTPNSLGEFTGYLMGINHETSEVVEVSIAKYSREKGYHDKIEKHPGEEGFEELQKTVFERLESWDYSEIRRLKIDYPQLYTSLKTTS